MTENGGDLDNERLHDLCLPQSSTRLIKSNRMRWAGLIARTAESRGAYRSLVVNLGRRRSFEELGVDGC